MELLVIGTIVNVITILFGSAIGVAVGAKIPNRTRTLITDALGLVTFISGASACVALWNSSYVNAVGGGKPILITLGGLLIGGVLGSLLTLEDRLERGGNKLRKKFARDEDSNFVTGFVSASLIFVIGPMAILGSISDGLGNGNELLILKSIMDGFAAIAFAAALGWGVAASAISVLIYQGAWSAIGALLGKILSDYQIDALTGVGGLLLIGIGLRLLNIKNIAIGDMLPALVVTPVLATLVALIN
ncbi:MAG: DUF554 domain-containing protein [Candidatus Nanopelagicaceae bacterium]